MSDFSLERMSELWAIEQGLSGEFGGDPFQRKQAEKASRIEAALSTHFEAATKQLVKNTHRALKTGDNKLSVDIVMEMNLSYEDLENNPGYQDFRRALAEKNIEIESIDLVQQLYSSTGRLATRHITFTLNPDFDLWANICYEWEQQLQERQQRRSDPSP